LNATIGRKSKVGTDSSKIIIPKRGKSIHVMEADSMVTKNPEK